MSLSEKLTSTLPDALKPLALVVDVVVQSGALCGRQSAGRVEVTPSAAAVGLSAAVHVVEVAEGRHARLWRVAHGEEAAEVSVFGAVAPFRVGQPSDGVLPLELDVHDVLPAVDLPARQLAHLALLLVDLHLLHHVCWQVVQ